jgi:23S rRNA (adenine-N6)-dimethyltransferase
VSTSDLVVEVGAGNGIFTRELGRLAQQVIAVEIDTGLAVGLVRRFSQYENVLVVAGDFFRLALPAQRFRIFGNIPFGSTTPLLRHLLSAPQSAMTRADLIVERGVALKRAGTRYGNVLNLGWAPWWVFTVGTQLPARSFSPEPSVDAAVLTIERRRVPLLSEPERSGYSEFLRDCFGASEIRYALRPLLSSRRFQALAGDLGIPPSASPPELDVNQWIGLYRAVGRPSRPPSR